MDGWLCFRHIETATTNIGAPARISPQAQTTQPSNANSNKPVSSRRYTYNYIHSSIYKYKQISVCIYIYIYIYSMYVYIFLYVYVYVRPEACRSVETFLLALGNSAARLLAC